MAGDCSKRGFTPSKNGKVSSTRRNTSILNFFQKADGPPTATSRQPRITQFTSKVERSRYVGLQHTETYSGADNSTESLFLEDKTGEQLKYNAGSTAGIGELERQRSRPDDIRGDVDSDLESLGKDDDYGDGEERYNENSTAAKKRKVDSSSSADVLGEARNNGLKSSSTTKQRSGPFIDESDSEEELGAFGDVEGPPPLKTRESAQESNIAKDSTEATECPSGFAPPSLVREATSHCVEDDEVADFDDAEDEEFRRKQFLEKPLETDEKEQDDTHDVANCSPPIVECADIPDSEASSCPICQTSFLGLSEMDFSVHVNNCLDGKNDSFTSGAKPMTVSRNLKRIELASIARAPQQDPYIGGYSGKTIGSSSAFSKLMAGNAEDTAWATAAAKDVGSRGKQAYQRTCPFYKIIPGFSICVDAFRYGAVQGCSAYFLSHFHSDHYMGLTSSWRHGPIYCSKVTGNLVRQQLRVDPKWVVDIEFEKKTEIPYTGGVNVTMIPANHCPGSSLFLFEKPSVQGPLAQTQRVLHCGDFRASPDHLQHPLLRPDVVDSTTGQTKQQQIDVCYLDTTYLNPKFAFPSQGDVIRACADICISLNQDNDDGQIPWGTEQCGKAMDKYFSEVNDSYNRQSKKSGRRTRLLVVMGTYSIGKERIYLGIARALNCKIYATAKKKRVCACLEDAGLLSLLTDDPLEAQVHLQTMFELRADTLRSYLDSMRPHFTRVVGIRPTGWNYRPPAGRMVDHPSVSSVLHSEHWKTPFTARDMVPQRGSTKESACFGVPYSEHSSFRELTMFCCGLRIARIVPTVNVGNQNSRERMKNWFERWEAEKKKNGLFSVDGEQW